MNEALARFQPDISGLNLCFPFHLIIRVRKVCLVLSDVADRGISSFWDHLSWAPEIISGKIMDLSEVPEAVRFSFFPPSSGRPSVAQT